MTASNPTPRSGESASGASYPQQCVACQSAWTHAGSLSDELEECPECGQPASPLGFFRWWAVEELATEVEAEIEVPAEVSSAVDTLVRAGGKPRADELLNVLALQYRFVEKGDE